MTRFKKWTTRGIKKTYFFLNGRAWTDCNDFKADSHLQRREL